MPGVRFRVIIFQAEYENTPPLASAGPDQTVFVGDTVQLDGSASSDADGDPFTYEWSVATRPAGSVAEIPEPTAVNTSFVPDAVGNYVIFLVVAIAAAHRVNLKASASTSLPRM